MTEIPDGNPRGISKREKKQHYSTITLTYLEQRSMTLILEKSSTEEEQEEMMDANSIDVNEKVMSIVCLR